MTGRTALSFFVLLLSVVSGSAQEKNAYSLQEAIDLALKNHPRVLIAQREIESAKGRRLQSFSPEKPELSFAWEGIPPGKPLSRANERSIHLSQSLEFPYKLLLRKDVFNQEIDIASENLSRTKALIAVEVKKSYYQVSYQTKLVQTLGFTVELLKQFQEATLFKYQSGDLLYFEVVRAKVEIAKTQNEVLEAKKELISAQTEFNLLLGKKGSEEFELADSLTYAPFEKSKKETAEELVHQNRTLKIAQLSREKESKSLRLAKTSFIPDLHFSGGYLSESGGKFIPSFEVGLSLPLWWWNPKGQIQENKANLRIAHTREQATERKVRSEIERWYELVKASEEQVWLFERTLLKEVDEELKSGINSYQYNQIDALSLLDIYRTNKISQTEYYRALSNYRSALAELEVAGEEDQ